MWPRAHKAARKARWWGRWRRGLLVALVSFLTLLRPLGGSPPTAQFVERFVSYDYADGARTTAWWDRTGGRLTLPQPDAGNERRWPALVAGQNGGVMVAWVEDRGEGAMIWAQHLDAHGNRLFENDLALAPWQGSLTSFPPTTQHLALAAIQPGLYQLVWSDEAGVWRLRWSDEQGVASPVASVDEMPGEALQERCLDQRCVLAWNRAGTGEIRFLDASGALVASLSLSGPARAAWGPAGDVWAVWREANGALMVMRYSPAGSPRWEEALRVEAAADNGPARGLEDIAVTPEAIWIVQPQPWTMVRVERLTAPPAQAWWVMPERNATVMRWATDWPTLTLLWQEDEPSSLWATWLDVSEKQPPEPRLLRAGAPGLEPLLGDVASANAGATAATWTEGNQAFVRVWLAGGWSPWRHEVSPAYAPSSGWVKQEGLGHSLEVNAPWEAVSAVTLDANVVLNGGTVQFYVSNQGPRAWKSIQPGQRLVFAEPGTRLRWYARLRRSAWGIGPEVREVSLVYEYERVQFWPQILHR